MREHLKGLISGRLTDVVRLLPEDGSVRTRATYGATCVAEEDICSLKYIKFYLQIKKKVVLIFLAVIQKFVSLHTCHVMTRVGKWR
jgi:hypothetical protein